MPGVSEATGIPAATQAHDREATAARRVRIAAAGDLHSRVDRPGRLRRFFGTINEEADLFVLAGDLTDHGDPEEAEMLAEELLVVRVPKIAVLGNHDYESGKSQEIARILTRGGIKVLDGDVYIFEKRLGIAGVKGFCGGFEQATLEPWGEETVKKFVLEAVNESLKLETALARIRGLEKRLALMHYAPVRSTVEGENPEIFPFLGCSRLEEPVDKFNATLAIHGHAHRGQLKGQTSRGVPVYNAAMELLHTRLDRRYVILEI
jgi:Icc-related predicted phosphoesterase